MHAGLLLDDRPIASLPCALPVPRATLAAFGLLRIATLPRDLVDALRPTATLAALDAADAAERAMAAEADGLTDALFAVVATTADGDRGFRRAILALKRAIFAGCPFDVDPAIAARLATALAPSAAAALERWQAAATCRQAALTAAEAHVSQELQEQARPALRAALAEPLFRDALAIASPSLHSHAARERDLPTKPRLDQFERSLLNYLLRATVKTSPFSSFMATTAIAIGPAGCAAPALLGLRTTLRLRLNRGIVVGLLRQAQLHPSTRHLPLRVNPTLQPLGPGRFAAIVSRLQTHLGRPWRQTAAANFRLAETVSAVLMGGHGGADRQVWADRFAAVGIDPGQAAALPVRLLERDLLQVDRPTGDFAEDATAWLAAELRAAGGSAADDLLAALDDIVVAPPVPAVRSAVPIDRAGQITAIERTIDAATAALGGTEGARLKNVVLEDCWADAPDGALSTAQFGAADDIADFLSGEVAVAGAFVLLRDTFVARFGAGGTCRDVVGFLGEAQALLGRGVEYGMKLQLPPAERAPVGTELPLTVQLQLIATDDATAPTAVVNKVFEGAGWLAARHAFGSGADYDRLRGGLAAWLHRVAAGAEPVDLPICGDCNDLQAHPQLTERVLAWPGSPLTRPAAATVELAALRLDHDPATQRLILRDPDSRTIQLFQLGSSLPSPTWGLGYALSVLSRPFEIMRPDFAPPVADGGGDIAFIPRVGHGRTVIKRAMWWVRADHLRRHWFAQGGVARLRDVRRGRADAGIPATVFARRPIDDQSGIIGQNMLEARRKPLWVDLEAPFSLDLLEHLIADVEWISLTEALPEGDGHSLTIAGRRHVSELQIEMLVRASAA